jgi:hypothetical protein
MITNSLTGPSPQRQSPLSARPAGLLGRLKRLARAKSARLTLVAAGIGFLGCGCAVEPGGYSSSFYEPDYSSYYPDYGYGGAAYDGGVYGGDIFIGGVHHHGYYGGHHMGHDFHGGGGGHWGGGGHGGGGHGGGGHGGGGHR